MSSKQVITKNSTCFLHLNIRSLKRNFDQLLLLVNHLVAKPIAICLSETWLNSVTDDINHFRIPNYHTALHVNRNIKKGGGVAIYLREDTKIVNTHRVETRYCESLFVELKINRAKVGVGVIYRPPNLSLNEFCKEFDETLEVLNQKNFKWMILGDFNLDILLNGNSQSQYCDVLQANGFINLINEPTRETMSSKSCLDHILTNYDINCFSHHKTMETLITDHYPVFATLKQTADFPVSYITKKTFHFLKNDQKKLLFKNHVSSSINSRTGYENMHQEIENFINKLKLCIDNYSTNKRIKTTHFYKNPWINNQVKKAISKRDRLHKTAIKTKDPSQLMECRKIRNAVNKLIRSTKRRYYSLKVAENLKNSRKLFSIFDSILGNKGKTSFPQKITCSNGNELTDIQDIVSHFNDYFANVGKNLSTQFPRQNFSFPDRVDFSFYMPPVSKIEVKELIVNLPSGKAAGYDEISNEVLKVLADVISDPLSVLINKCLAKGVFPDCLKVAQVVPIYKDEDNSKAEN